MPAYIPSPFQNPILAMKGVATYLWGKFSQQTGNSRLALTNTALTSNVATVTVLLVQGPQPVVGSLISIINSTNTSGLFNVNRAIITAVTVDSITGAGTITFALTHANVTATADAGTVIVEPAEVGETISGSANSIACVYQAPEGDSQFTVPMAVTSGSGITALTATLQVAIKNTDSEYTNTTYVVTKTGATTYSAGPVVQATLQRGYCYRIALSGVTGSDVVVGKLG